MMIPYWCCSKNVEKTVTPELVEGRDGAKDAPPQGERFFQHC